MSNADVMIVGAGAAGLAAGIFCARLRPDLRITILDGAQKIGAKILVSGGGRCNVTNVRVIAEDFWGGSRNTIRRVLRAFTEKQTVEFFHEIGVSLHEEQWGKLFPDSNSAKTVLNALLSEAGRLGVTIMPGHRVVDIQHCEVFEIQIDVPRTGSKTLTTGCVVLATGGRSLPKSGSDGLGFQLAQSLGHSLVEQTPGLVPLELDDTFHGELSGIAHEVELTIKTAHENPVRISGPMLWTHFGVSGPAVLDASRHWHRAKLLNQEVTFTANFLPGSDFVTAEARLLDLTKNESNTLVRNALAALIPNRLAEMLCREVEIPGRMTMGQLDRDRRRRLVHVLIEREFRIRGSRGYNYAEVTAGGVPLDEIDPSTMASRKCPGLFLVGEILDVDGRIGGFNFQWAWSSAHVTASGIARFFS
ncbi:MAG: aminoacetone oxidase family FAD-binding enzyme [Planctomycetes bacterium]|nr:aminoacetone oxidase family FAD-binding enzyme [Planctomycetota bacterium]